MRKQLRPRSPRLPRGRHHGNANKALTSGAKSTGASVKGTLSIYLPEGDFLFVLFSAEAYACGACQVPLGSIAKAAVCADVRPLYSGTTEHPRSSANYTSNGMHADIR